MIRKNHSAPFFPQGAPDDGGTQGNAEAGQFSIFPVEWPDLTESWGPESAHSVGVHVQSIVTRPLAMHIALVTMTVQTSYYGEASLRLSLEPAVPDVHVAILRAFPIEDARLSNEASIGVPLPAGTGCSVRVEVRLDGPQVGREPPPLNIWASVRATEGDRIDEAITARRITPRLSIDGTVPLE